MRLLHYSQRFSRKPAVLSAMLADLLADEDVATLTEVADKARAAVLPRPDFTVTQDSKDGVRAADCAILSRNSVYTVVDSQSWHLTTKAFRTSRGHKVDGWWAQAAVLQDTAGVRTLVTVGHSPSHLVSLARRRSHRAGVREWNRRVTTYASQVGATQIIVAADWNKNLGGKKTRAYLQDHFPGFKLVAPKDGTLGRRPIDGLLVSGFDPVTVKVGPATKASDHKPVSFVLQANGTKPPIVPPPTTFPAPDPEYLGPAKFHGDTNNKPINRLVVHATVGPCKPGEARSIADYFKRTVTRPSSAHYVVDPDEDFQVVYDSVVAYHAPPNEHSLGVEFTFTPTHVPIGQWLLPNQRRMIRRGARLFAELALAYDVPVVRLSVADLLAGKRGICGHIDISNAWHQTTHWDPGQFPWHWFMRLVRKEVENIKAGK